MSNTDRDNPSETDDELASDVELRTEDLDAVAGGFVLPPGSYGVDGTPSSDRLTRAKRRTSVGGDSLEDYSPKVTKRKPRLVTTGVGLGS